MRKLVVSGLTALSLVAGVAWVQAAASVQAGMLTCNVDGGAGFVFGSGKMMNCMFKPAGSGPVQRYTGLISRWGVDLGFTHGGVLSWAVLTKSHNYHHTGALAGSYGGVGAEATAALGVGANVLVRKSVHDFVLQPINVQGQTGLNLALGVAELDLASATK